MNSVQEVVQLCRTIIGPTVVEVDKALINATIDDLQREGLFVVQIDTDPIRNLDDLLNAFYEKCSFPEWFGFNEAALKDMLLDFHWLPAAGYIFAFFDIHEMDDKTLRLFLLHFTLAHEIKEQKVQKPLKLLLPSDARNENLQNIIDNTLKVWFPNKK